LHTHSHDSHIILVPRWTVLPGKVHDMHNVSDMGCPRHSNSDSHVSSADMSTVVVFEPDQVLPVYRTTSWRCTGTRWPISRADVK